jgi:anti-sigma factor RsiW
MSGHDAFNEELLSAYLDGELSSEEREEVERTLARSAEYRELLEELRSLVKQLEQLPSSSLDEAFSDRVIERTKHIARPQGDEASPAELQPELLSAFVDGELTEDQSQFIEGMLETDVEGREYVNQLQDLDRRLQSLPSYHLDDAFAERVLARAEGILARQDDRTKAPDESVTVAGPVVETGASLRGFVWALVAVAAAVALAFFFRGETTTGPQDLAKTPSVPQTPEVDPETEDDPTGPDVAVVPPDTREGGGTGPEIERPGPPQLDGTWQVLADFRKNAKPLIWVYELTITSEGVEKGAFANLLRRHKIRFGDTVPVSEEEQGQLLRQRYLEGVKVVSEKTKGMDKVRLYLVTCKGHHVDAIYQDLVGRPRGIGSFFINLTTRGAGDDVLNRLCDASDIAERSSEAVELLGNFAIMSRTARELGMFGTIRWIEPDLLIPPQPDDEEDEATTDDGNALAVGKKELAGDFKCEILFVVRNLQPIDDEEDPGE